MTSSVFRDSFLAEQAAELAERTPIRDRLWAARQEFVSLVAEAVPNFELFHHHVECTGSAERALATGAFEALVHEGYAKTTANHLSASNLSRCAAWSVEWIDSGCLQPDTAVGDFRNAEVSHKVVLTVQVDREAKRIDTEFFLWNSRQDGEVNPLDDTEKLHIVWDMGDDANLDLAYLGFGANQPYATEHPSRSQAPQHGRPRFYIYDRDRNLERFHRFEVVKEDVFDWNWAWVPVVEGHERRVVTYIEFPDGTRHCISDPAVAAAMQGLSPSYLVQRLLEDEGVPPDGFGFEDLAPSVQKKLMAMFRRVSVAVSAIETRELPREPPEIAAVLQQVEEGYPAYFQAFCTRAIPVNVLLRDYRKLGQRREAEMTALLARDMAEIVAPEVAPHVPGTVRHYLEVGFAGVPDAYAEALQDWRRTILQGLQEDFYHAGQYPDARSKRLLFGARLALDDRFGNVYGRVLEACKARLTGGVPFGTFDIELPNRELAADDA